MNDENTMNNSEEELAENIIILNDENGQETKFEFLDLIDYEDEEYVVLLPVEDMESETPGEVVILKVEDNDDPSSETESYVSVDNEEVLNRIFDIFKDRFKNEFDFVD